MEVSSPAAENTPRNCPSLGQQSEEQKDELGLGYVQSQSMDVTALRQENNLKINSQSLEQNTSEQLHKSGMSDVPSVPTCISSLAPENSVKTDNLSPIENSMEHNHESGLQDIQTEAMDATPMTPENSLKTKIPSPKYNIMDQESDPGLEDVQSEPMGSRTPENGFIEKTSSPKQNIHEPRAEDLQREAVEVTPKNSEEINNPSLGQIIKEQDPRRGSGDVERETIGVSSPSHENGLKTNSLSPIVNNIEHKHESEFGQTEAVDITEETSFMTKSPSSKQKIVDEKHESGVGDVQLRYIGSRTQENGITSKTSNPEQNTLEQKHEPGTDDVQSEAIGITSTTQGDSLRIDISIPEQNILNQKRESGFGNIQNEAMEIASSIHCTTESLCPSQIVVEQELECGFGGGQSAEINVTSPTQENGLTTETASPNQNISVEKHEPDSENVQNEPPKTRSAGCSSIDAEALEIPKDTPKNSSRSVSKRTGVSSKSKRKSNSPRSLGSSRVLRSRESVTPKAPEPSNSSANVNTEREKKRKKRKITKSTSNDEFARTRKRVRYILNRMNYEHSLIEAYAGEGWKGQSGEKIKLEKELERATSEILRCKLRLRDLFQNIDISCAEGRFEESVFDSNGEIDSEDIFCAKCRSEDLSLENDIILCDGICNRGFHQMCLNPPLLKEQIPQGDEGWLCPGCDCKVDCIDLLNDHLGTDLSIEDNWEKVFPEAAATAAGNKLDDNFDYPSDDSEDIDYDPNSPVVDEKVEEEEGSSSDESDFTSASDDSEDLPHEDPLMGLPSDDSEDDDFDPDAPDVEENVKRESSSSDFTSDSGDSGPLGDDSEFLGKDEIPGDETVNGPALGRSNGAKRRKGVVNSELLSIQETGNISPVSGKRHREQLDYKKLHDETYGNASSDSSDDEDWKDADGQGKRKKSSAAKESVSASKGSSRTTRSGATTSETTGNLEKTENAQKRRVRQKMDMSGKNKTPTHSNKESLEPGTAEKSANVSGHKILGKAVTEKLHESLKENEYPNREKKEQLAEELGITVQQVNKWFINTRWSLRHPGSRSQHSSAKKENMLVETEGKTLEPEQKILPEDNSKKVQSSRESGEAGDAQAKESTPKKLTAPKLITGRNRKGNARAVAVEGSVAEGGSLQKSTKPKLSEGRKRKAVEDIAEESTPQKSAGPVLRNKRNNKAIEKTPKTPKTSEPKDSDKVQTPRRSSRNTSMEVKGSSSRTRSRNKVA